MRDIHERRQTASMTMALLAAALVLPACSNEGPVAPTPPTQVFVSQTQTTNIGGNPTASPSPSASGCAIASVGNALHGGSGERTANIAVGEQRLLDTTPKGPDGRVLAEGCPIAPVSWSISQAVLSCRLNSSAIYTPQVTAVAPGTCELRATVGTVTAGEPIVITVRAAGTLWLPQFLDDPPAPIPRWVHD